MRGARGLGFTMIEFVMVILIIGILAAATVPMLEASYKAYSSVGNEALALDRVRYATERLAREIRDVAATTTGGLNFTTISTSAPVFTTLEGCPNLTTPCVGSATGRLVTIAQTGTSPNITVSLTYDSPAVTATLVDKVSSLVFTFYRDDGATTENTDTTLMRYVQVALTTTVDSKTYTQQTTVRLRNSQ